MKQRPQTRFALAGVRCKSRETGLNPLLTDLVPRCRIAGCRPHEPRMTTMLLRHSNGELGDGSSNKTPHMVVPIPLAPLVAHRLQLLRVIVVKGKEGRENARAIKLYCGVGEDTRGRFDSLGLNRARDGRGRRWLHLARGGLGRGYRTGLVSGPSPARISKASNSHGWAR